MREGRSEQADKGRFQIGHEERLPTRRRDPAKLGVAVNDHPARFSTGDNGECLLSPLVR